MPGPPVTVGCAVTLTPGAAGAPDAGLISAPAPGPPLTFAGLPLITAGATCQMVNSVTGVPYPIVIPPLGASTGVANAGMALVRVGDRIALGPAILLIGGPPAAPTITDAFPP